MWVPKSRVWSPAESPLSIEDYFCFNIRSTSHGAIRLFSVTPVRSQTLFRYGIFESDSCDGFTPFSALYLTISITRPWNSGFIACSEKMNVLQSRLDDARDMLGAEYIPDDLTSKAEIFRFKASSGCDTAAQFLADLVAHLGRLLGVVEAECKQKAEQFKESLAINQISFDLLEFLEYYHQEGAVHADYVGIEKGDLDI
ncbi:hypothetical protein K503DRAFT_121265 [Rhizopogon vinicolor AM-OR11-026]|uniref:Uncharacterized protein n=1 Tax=Rhizopogon vinicolor AM-OR11-026 TaxID=1314800 RepID=A0A1B7MEQ8_9AGAM|nr:hypothetical protein K503DRAFT_121265 [Rhizopogon vinicolor AM-OR11-026]